MLSSHVILCTSFLQQGAGTWSACRGHSSENEGEMVGDEAGEGIHKPIEVGFNYFWSTIQNLLSFLVPKDIHVMLKLVERAEYDTYKVSG